MKTTSLLPGLLMACLMLTTGCVHDYATRPQPGTSQDPNVVRNSSSGSITPAAPDDGR